MKKTISIEEKQELIYTLKDRFQKNLKRHKKLEWSKIEEKLNNNDEKLWSLYEMEKTGGEPDIVDYDSKKDEYIFYDCSPETPTGRRALCYDQEALNSRKEHKPKSNVINMAEEMEVNLLTEEEYRFLQTLGEFDTKTSSWIKTPDKIRKLGGAIFADRRFDTVFVYHNGASSYYSGRGFRASIRF